MSRPMERFRAEWQENGCVRLPRLLDAEALARCQRAFEATRWTPAKTIPRTVEKGWNDATGLRGVPLTYQMLLEEYPVLAQACLDLWGSSKSVWLYDHEIFHKVKTGDADRGTPFHRDTTTTPFFGEHLANLWIPLEPDFLPKESCLEVVRGSHKTSSSVKDTRWAKDDLCSWAMSKGDVVVAHSHTIHGGGPVSADCPERRSVVLRVFGDDCVYRSRRFSANDRRYEGMVDGDHFSLAGAAVNLHPLVLGPGLPDLHQGQNAAKAAKL